MDADSAHGLFRKPFQLYHAEMISDIKHRTQISTSEPDQLAEYQLARFNQLIEAILPANSFYGQKLHDIAFPLESLDQLESLPFTTKNDLIEESQHPGFAANLTHPIDQYVRFHRTSGTKGRPLVVLDTAKDWQWWMESWQYVLDAAQLDQSDRVLMAFSFGPFIGFWTKGKSHQDAISRAIAS